MFPFPGIIIKAECVLSVPCPARRLAAPEIDFFFPRFRKSLKAFLQKGSKHGMQVKRICLMIEMDEGWLGAQQLLRVRRIHLRKLTRLCQRKTRKDGNGKEKAALRFGKAVPKHLLHELIHARAGKIAVFDVCHNLHMQRHYPSVRRLMHGEYPAS